MGVRAASTFSLLLIGAAFAGAQSYGPLRDQLQGLPSEQVIHRVASDEVAVMDEEIATALSQAEGASPERREKVGEQLRGMVELKALGEGSSADAKSVAAAAQSIKNSPVYRDSGLDEQSNWLGRALARLRNIHIDWPKGPDAPQMGNMGFGRILVNIVWVLLGLGILYLLYLAIRHVEWKAKLARRAKAVLEEDEPERTLDEWLAQADELAAKGQYREAVRALYLACLLRFDEHRVARFIRGETNWEHLARIQASDRRPADLDFRPATQAFDRIWYGKRVRGREDVEMFRAWYTEITANLSKRSAA